jgi:hypothetical protein
MLVVRLTLGLCRKLVIVLMGMVGGGRDCGRLWTVIGWENSVLG